MNLKAQREAALKAARDLAEQVKADGRGFTPEEQAQVEAYIAKADELATAIKSQERSDELLSQLGSFDAPEQVKAARDVAEHFVKSGAWEQMKSGVRSGARFSVGSPEFKAATDPTLTTGITIPASYGPVVETKYRALTVADLLASGTLSGNSLTYWTQGALTGDVTSVAEGGLKPSLNFAFGQVTETLTKLAGVTKVSDEMTEDADFLVSVIRSQLIQRLALVEEDQLLNGNGTAPNLRGLLNRVGIQTYATTATASAKKWMDGLFHAQQMVRTGSYLNPDGIIVNPADYEYMRLGVDGQQQYYGGGPFTGAYGNSGIQLQPGLWGRPTVVTPAIAAGTALVGAFGSANSNEDDFKRNLVAIRAEERIALAVFYPTGLVKVTLTA